MTASNARRHFERLAGLPEAQIDLAEAALTIAREEYPDLDVEEYVNALDTMADELRERLADERYPLRILQGINRYLYDDLSFRGNDADYYDPRNSMLNEVIDRRTGIPITLALVYMEVARRVDFPMVGIGMPGHFLIRPDRPDMEIFVDAFHNGEILFTEDCQLRLNQTFGRPVPLQPMYLESVGPRRFLARMLTNLKLVYLQREELDRSLATIERLLLLFPGTPVELRDRGIVLYRLGRSTEARRDLEAYLRDFPEASDAALVRELLSRLPE
jgi:regulator of sirC expression with transglutaminase-like and TPR domain